jgi:hypothetical protein
MRNVPLSGRGGIEDHGNVRGLFTLDEVQQRKREAEGRTGVHALAVHARCADKAEVRAVDQGVGIQQKEALVVVAVLVFKG